MDFTDASSIPHVLPTGQATQSTDADDGGIDVQLRNEMRTARDVGMVGALCRRFTRALGFDHFLVACRVPMPLDQPCQYVINGYPRGWREHYDAHGFMLIDPVVARANNSVVPFAWSELDRSTDSVRHLFTVAASHGLGHGLSAPVHGPRGEGGLMSVARSTPLPANPAARLTLDRRLLLFAAETHEAMRRLAVAAANGAGNARPQRVLTARERECLRGVAAGMIDREIALKLGVTERTVRFHMDRAFGKLGARNRAEAIARAVALGVVTTVLYHPQLAQSQGFVDLGAQS